VSLILVFFLVVLSFAFVFDNMTRTPVDLKVNYLETGNISFVEYSAVPVLAENLRFDHDLISYYIASDCDAERRDDMVEAFNIFSDAVKIVSFYEVDKNADILVGCSNDFVDLGGDYFAAGEGGPSRIVNTGLFRVIEEGRIWLYDSDEDCDYPVVALHELCHVFGFDHSEDPGNIMYNVSDCWQRLSGDMVDLIVDLYSVEALAELSFGNVSASYGGRFLDFEVLVLNDGLVGASDFRMVILDGEEVLDEFDFGDVGVGSGRVLRVENLEVGRGVEGFDFVLDYYDDVRELDEGNNRIEVFV